MASVRYRSRARLGSEDSDDIFSPAVFNFDHLERSVQTHLMNVYTCLSIGMLSAAAGAYLHLITGIGQWFLLIFMLAVVLLIWLSATHNSKDDSAKRMAIFTAFCLTLGTSMGPLIELAILIDPSVIFTALTGTAVVFIGFSLSALMNRNRHFLYLGAFLFTGLFWLLLMGIINIFIGSQLLFDVYVYGGLFVFSGLVLYDTQLIVEKRRMGDDDYIWHSVDLFLDIINIFKLLLVILLKRKS